MANNKTLIELWNFMELSEKQQLMQQFRKMHGNHYTKSDFLRFLAERYKDVKMRFKTIDGEPIYDEAVS